MSFSSETKAELCDSRLEKRNLALAECYGVLLYCNTFRTSEIRIITASASFSERLPRLFKKAFSFGFDQLPPENAVGKRSFCIQDPEKITRILESFGGDAGGPISHHINLGILEDPGCSEAFVKARHQSPQCEPGASRDAAGDEPGAEGSRARRSLSALL